jgi:hypothetical protein
MEVGTLRGKKEEEKSRRDLRRWEEVGLMSGVHIIFVHSVQRLEEHQ